MKKLYKVLKTTVIEGRPEREGARVELTDDEAKGYPKDVIEEIKPADGEATQGIDLAPSELPSDVHDTKRTGTAETAADKKAATAEEK